MEGEFGLWESGGMAIGIRLDGPDVLRSFIHSNGGAVLRTLAADYGRWDHGVGRPARNLDLGGGPGAGLVQWRELQPPRREVPPPPLEE